MSNRKQIKKKTRGGTRSQNIILKITIGDFFISKIKTLTNQR